MTAQPQARYRIAMVTHFFASHRGGIEIVAGRSAQELVTLGMDVTWLATDASPPPDGGPTRSVSLRASNLTERLLGIPFPLLFPGAIRRIAAAARDAEVVLVHDALYMTSVVAFLAARWHGRPILIVQHIGAVPYRNPVLRLLMGLANRVIARPLLSRADQTVFISETTAGYFAGLRYRVRPELIHNGVDTRLFAPPDGPAEVARARALFDLPGQAPIVLFVGRFVEKKGLGVIRRLAPRFPDALFVFAGWGGDDPTAWGLSNIRVLGALDHDALASLYRAADVLLLPSVGEGFPLVVQEALASGLAVLCGADTAMADPAATPLVLGVVVTPADPEGTAQRFGDALRAALSAAVTPEQRGMRADFARRRYDWRASTLSLVGLMVRALERRKDGAARAL